MARNTFKAAKSYVTGAVRNGAGKITKWREGSRDFELTRDGTTGLPVYLEVKATRFEASMGMEFLYSGSDFVGFSGDDIDSRLLPALIGEATGLGGSAQLPDVFYANVVPRTNTRANLVALAGNGGEIASAPANGKLVLFTGNAGEAMEFDTISAHVRSTFSPAELAASTITLTADEATRPILHINLASWSPAVAGTCTINRPSWSPNDPKQHLLISAIVDTVINFNDITNSTFKLFSSTDFTLLHVEIEGGAVLKMYMGASNTSLQCTSEEVGSAVGGIKSRTGTAAGSVAYGSACLAIGAGAVALGNVSKAVANSTFAVSGGRAMSSGGMSLGLNSSASAGLAAGGSSAAGMRLIPCSSITGATITFLSTWGDFRGHVPATGSVTFRVFHAAASGQQGSTTSYTGNISSWAFGSAITLTLAAALSLPAGVLATDVYLVVSNTTGSAYAIGAAAYATHAGQHARAGFTFDSAFPGTAQKTETYLRKTTTATTAIELTTDGNAVAAGTAAAVTNQVVPGTSNRLIVPHNKALDMRVTILAKHTGASANVAKWVYRVTAVNNNGTVSILDGPTSENQFIAAGMGAPTVAIAAGALGTAAVTVTVTPGNVTSTRWLACVEALELA